MAAEGLPVMVKAIYAFKGTNNDELNFQKHDIITVTQMPDGGWWEGTLKGVTGWFPSNYVKEYKHDLVTDRKSAQDSKINDALNARQENIKIYRNVVLKNIIDSELTHVNELQSLLKTFLHPLQISDIIQHDKYFLLVGNLEDVIDVHVKLLKALEECNEVVANQQKIGGAFMQLAPQFKNVHLNYCSNHPKAVTVLEKHRDELSTFMENHGATSPGHRALTVGLSKPFRRLEKYHGFLLELEHHIEESHADRGDTQRAAHVYKDIKESCYNMRRQKEMELEVLQGNIRGWEGEDVQNLGEILLMTQVSVIKEGQDSRDRHLALFPSTLVLLSVSSRMSTFVYEGKLPLAGINVSQIEDTDTFRNAFEITGNMIDKITVQCSSMDERDKWMEMMKQQIRVSRTSVVGSTKPPMVAAHHAPPSPLVTSLETKSQISTAKVPYCPPNQIWTNTCLRPAPPLRPCMALGSKEDVNMRRSVHRFQKSKDDHAFEDDARILRVIEAYCTSAKTRYTVNSTFIDSPQVILPEEEKIINEVTSGNQTIIEEKSLVDTVYALKDQIKDLQQETRVLTKAFEDEQKSRKRLEEVIRKYLLAGREDIKWDD